MLQWFYRRASDIKVVVSSLDLDPKTPRRLSKWDNLSVKYCCWLPYDALESRPGGVECKYCHLLSALEPGIGSACTKTDLKEVH